jgi:endogenous inhibitor of DNA gyrase (YacG/DUF329 family)
MKVTKQRVLQVAEEVTTLREGAEKLNISLERFRKILRQGGSTKFTHVARLCRWCGKSMKGVPGATRYCSSECLEAAREKRKHDGMMTSVCAGCGREFLHPKRVKRTFCSKVCQGHWLAKVRWEGKERRKLEGEKT